MSQGTACKCSESKKKVEERAWYVVQRNSRCSAFDGYRSMYSDYSAVMCGKCGCGWRTKAQFVEKLESKEHAVVYDMAFHSRKEDSDVAG